MRTPEFWFKNKSLYKYLFFPLTFFWKSGFYFKKKISKHEIFPIPIICIGNIIMGGGGKTPLAMAIAKDFKKIGKKVHIIYKAFNTRLNNKALEVKKNTSPNIVGDEPILASSVTRTWISNRRRDSIECAMKNQADLILLDDGFQDFSIKKDFSLLTINNLQGFGNGFLFPSGPLREEIKKGLERANCIFFYGNKKTFNKLVPNYKKPVFFVKTKANKKKLSELYNKKYLAFAGIAHPNNFFDILKSNKVKVIKKYYFSDHKKYNDKELERIIKEAEKRNLHIITTEKDYVKIPKKYKKKVNFFPIEIEYDSKQFIKLLEKENICSLLKK